ncbi:MAG: hypothetical protein IPO51_15915 [Dehalococcoidia bacterium]|nr:hypothetical protein [Dehalococcoidia bacterium]
MPVLFSLAALVLAVTAVAVLIVTDGDGTNTANAEDPYAPGFTFAPTRAGPRTTRRRRTPRPPTTNHRPARPSLGPYDGGRPVFGEGDKNGASSSP